jgi:hypothetical protein
MTFARVITEDDGSVMPVATSRNNCARHLVVERTGPVVLRVTKTAADAGEPRASGDGAVEVVLLRKYVPWRSSINGIVPSK